MGKDNIGLQDAKRNAQDDFYTSYVDIENELQHYDKSHFKGKVVYCNADDHRTSNFVRYFKNNFKRLELKRLVATGMPLPDAAPPLSDPECYEYDGSTVTITPLRGNGDFRSEECQQLLKQADIIITNPPFSLFREFIAQFFPYENQNQMSAISYQDIEERLNEGRGIEDLKGKVIYCPFCHWQTSNFVAYFKENFTKLRLKKLIATAYILTDTAPLFRLTNHYTYDGETTTITPFESEQVVDFRSEQIQKIFKEADVIIGEPPSAILRQFIHQRNVSNNYLKT